jgi:hypothetical protein
MGYASAGVLLVKYGKYLGPMAVKAVQAAGPKVADALQNNEPMKRAINQAQERMRSGASKTARQIELGQLFAAEALQEQIQPERQDVIRAWAQKLKVQERKLQTTANMTSRPAAKARRAEVGAAVDEIVADIITTLDAWNEADLT